MDGAIVMIVVIALVVLLAGGLVMRYNQLSLAAELCHEGLKQLRRSAADRQLLVPAFIETATAVSGTTPEIDQLGRAFADARRAKTAEAFGRSEQALTVAIEEVAAAAHIRRHADAGRNSGFGGAGRSTTEEAFLTASFVHVQLRGFESRIAAGVRYYNLNVNRYRRRRGSLASLPVRFRFPELRPVDYTELDLDPMLVSEQVLRTLGEDRYRPGRLGDGQ